MTFRRSAAAIVLCLPLLLAVSCGGDDPNTSLVTPSPGAPTSTPEGDGASSDKIKITSPEEGDTIKASEAKVVVEVQGFDLVDKIGDEAKDGEGHILYYAGVGYEVPVTPGVSARAGGSGGFTSYPSAETSYTWPSAAKGTQTFTVQLVNNDDTPLDPPQTAQVTVTIDD